jgi:phosphomannomutase/phosphoglucomutase
MKINPDIFRAYDIRGIVDKDLTPEIAELIGKAFGTYLLERGTKDVLIGRDTRATSEEYQEMTTRGLLSTGCNVIDIGLTLSSILYFARQHYRVDGGVLVTASHNPSEWNGFKLCHGINAIVEEEIQKVKDILISEKFKSGLQPAPRLSSKRLSGRIKALNIFPTYLKALKERIKIKKPLKIVVDGGEATPSIFIPKILEELGCKTIPIYCNVNPRSPRGFLDPVKLNHYQDLIKKVKEEKADLGILLDGDGDRVGFVDERGQVWLGDVILMLLIRKIIPKNPKRKVIIEVKDSEAVVEETKRLGGIPIFWKTGHALLDHKVFEEKAILCGEMSCHYWITENWYYFDDALYALARVLKIVSDSGKSLSELVAELPKYEATPEYRIPCPEDKKFKLVEELVEYFRPQCDKVVDIDGIRGYIGDGWFLIRASNTQPLIAVRCEAKSKAGLEKIKKLIKNKLDEYPYLRLDRKKQS